MVIEPTWWPILRDAVDARYAGQEWPVEAMAADLAWERAEEAAGRGRVPGRPTLRARWRTTEFRVRVLLGTATTTATPAHRQPTASRPPAAAPANAANHAETASRPPADRQPTASSAPEAPVARTATTTTATTPEAAQLDVAGERAESPAHRQPTASAPPAAAPANAANHAETASRPPADRQPTASAGVSPAAGTLSPPTPPPIPQPDHSSERSGDQGGAGGQSPAEEWPTSAHPAAVAFLKLIRRWSTTDDEDAKRLTPDQRWKVKPAADLNWFLTDLMLSPEAKGLDLVAALGNWGDWVESQARRLASKQSNKFPKNWKAAMRNGLKFAQERCASSGGPHGTGTARGAFAGTQQKFNGIRQDDGRGRADEDWRRDWE